MGLKNFKAISEPYLGPYQSSMMELSAKIVNDSLTIFAKALPQTLDKVLNTLLNFHKDKVIASLVYYYKRPNSAFCLSKLKSAFGEEYF